MLACRWRLAALELAAAERLLREGRTDIELRSERLRAARAAREQAAAELDRLRQRDAALAADLARLGERRRAIGDEAARLEADRTRLRDLDEQLERDLGDAQIALEDARSAIARLAAERAGLAEQQAGLAPLLRAGGDGGSSDARRRSKWPRPSCAGHSESRRRLEARARQLRERLVRSAEGRRALAEAEQQTERELAALAESAAPEHGSPAGEPADAAVRAAEAAVHPAEEALDRGRARARHSPGRA